MKPKLINLRSLLTALFITWMMVAAAQTTVKGLVTDETGEPLIGEPAQPRKAFAKLRRTLLSDPPVRIL